MVLERCGDRAFLIRLGELPTPALSQRIAALRQALVAAGPAGLEDAVPGFVTLLVVYDPDITTMRGLADLASALLPPDDAPTAQRHWTIPVCYDASLAPDIHTVARQLQLTCEEVVRLHTSVSYVVYLLGFSPGFPYLGDVDPKLFLERRAEPRARVPAGSVAIATRYTAIYPQDTAGGWHLIGRTPVKLFDAGLAAPALLQPGDRVCFQAVSCAEYESLSTRIAAGAYTPPCRTEAV